MASEKRLIDANALIEEIMGLKVVDPYRKKRGLSNGGCEIMGMTFSCCL